MTLQQLKYIVEIYKCGSITDAAHRLFIAQPSLSKAVKDLEEEFQIIILKRSRHGVSFTEDGMKFLQFAHRIVDTSADMKQYFDAAADAQPALHLSISSQHYMFPIDALIQFVNRISPSRQYTIRISEVRTTQVIKDVMNQTSQIGILYVSDFIRSYMYRLFEHNDLQFTPFYHFPPYVYLSKTHPLAKQSAVTAEQLVPYPYIRYEQGGDPYQFSEEFIIPRVKAKQTIYVTDRSTLFSFLKNTQGYNVGTGCLIPSIADDCIVSIPLHIDDAENTMEIGWLKKKNTLMNREMKEYVQDMEKTLRQIEPKQPVI